MCLGDLAFFIYENGIFFFKYLLNIENKNRLTDKNKWLTSNVSLGHYSSPPASQKEPEWGLILYHWPNPQLPVFSLLCLLLLDLQSLLMQNRLQGDRRKRLFTQISTWHGGDHRPFCLATATSWISLFLQELVKLLPKNTSYCACISSFGKVFPHCLDHWQPASTFANFIHGHLAFVCSCAKSLFSLNSFFHLPQVYCSLMYLHSAVTSPLSHCFAK